MYICLCLLGEETLQWYIGSIFTLCITQIDLPLHIQSSYMTHLNLNIHAVFRCAWWMSRWSEALERPILACKCRPAFILEWQLPRTVQNNVSTPPARLGASNAPMEDFCSALKRARSPARSFNRVNGNTALVPILQNRINMTLPYDCCRPVNSCCHCSVKSASSICNTIWPCSDVRMIVIHADVL